MITGTMNVPMTLEKANYYNTLEKRDTALPMVETEYEWDGETKKFYTCPICGESIYGEQHFCKKCGQRIDTENIEL